ALQRPEAISSPDATLEQVVADGCSQIGQSISVPIDILVVLLCNAPTVTAEMIDTAVEMLSRDSSRDLVASVSKRNEFKPQRALRINDQQQLEPFVRIQPASHDVFFADALLWAVRRKFIVGRADATNPHWLMDFSDLSAAPLVHRGYGDVDYRWQVPAVEGWMKRNGYTLDA